MCCFSISQAAWQALKAAAVAAPAPTSSTNSAGKLVDGASSDALSTHESTQSNSPRKDNGLPAAGSCSADPHPCPSHQLSDPAPNAKDDASHHKSAPGFGGAAGSAGVGRVRGKVSAFDFVCAYAKTCHFANDGPARAAP